MAADLQKEKLGGVLKQGVRWAVGPGIDAIEVETSAR